MKERSQHDDTYLTGAEKGKGPAALWLAVIPVVFISLLGLAAGFSALSKARDEQAARPLGTDAGAMTVPPESLPARPDSRIAGRPMRPPMTSTTTVKTRAGVVGARRRPTVARSTQANPGAWAAPVEPAPASAPASGCEAAVQWLSAHAAPGFRLECPGYALGHQAMTCVNVAGVCPGQRIIAVADACPAAYMNEAHNSWILVGLATGRLDPYGNC